MPAPPRRATAAATGRRSRSTVGLPLRLLGLSGLLTLLLAAIFFDAFPYDVLAYHGPFAALATGLPRLSRYGMTTFMEQRQAGFPALWRWLLAPGLGLGMPRLLLLPNLLALLALLATCRRVLGLAWPVSLATALLFPIALFGFRTPYQDFFVGALSSAAVLLLIEALRQGWQSGAGARPAWLALPLLLAVSLTKYQGLLMALLALGLALPAALLLRGHRSGTPTWRRGPLPVLLLTALLCTLHPLHNLQRHHNPFFPIAVGPFPGPEIKSGAEAPAYTAPLGPLSPFLNHWLSATELDWLARGVVPSYNLDQAGARLQHGGLLDPRPLPIEIRSGGSFAPAYLLAMAGYGLAFAQALGRGRRGDALSPQSWAVIGVAPFLLLGAGLPQSHELRYYLPLLMLPALSALAWRWPGLPERRISALLLTLLAVSQLLNFAQPLHSTAKGWLRGEGLRYAIGYPVRDLPSVADCLRHAGRPEEKPGTLRLPTGMAFACRMQLPAALQVEAAEDLPQAASGDRVSGSAQRPTEPAADRR